MSRPEGAAGVGTGSAEGSTASRMACDVLVVGGGPAGLTAATALRAGGAGRVLLVEREAEPGGIPRHSDHAGYGLADLRRPMSGPGYARHLARTALDAGVEVLTSTTVTGWTGERSLALTGPEGISQIDARAVVLATGCRERPRHARLVPGSRPAGVYTTGSLQQAVHLRHLPVGRRAVVVGGEHVAFSALLTLAHAGVRSVALLTELPRHQTYAPLALATAGRMRVPVLTGTRLVRVLGRQRVEGVEVAPVEGEGSRVIECDTLVFTADWIPDHELARLGGLALDPLARGPLVDVALRTSRPGVFAAGNLLRGAETADICALEGRHVAVAALAWLAGGAWPAGDGGDAVRVRVKPPLSWICPGQLHLGQAGAHAVDRPPRGRFSLRLAEVSAGDRVEVRQGGRSLWTGRLESGLLAGLVPALARLPHRGPLLPGRSLGLRADWLERVRAGDGDVEVVLLR